MAPPAARSWGHLTYRSATTKTLFRLSPRNRYPECASVSEWPPSTRQRFCAAIRGVRFSTVIVTFPDGSRVRASSIADRRADDRDRSYGLYLDSRWEPTWPADLIEWRDFGLPADAESAAGLIESAFGRARRGELVEVGCLGGLGRTGTVLACMAFLSGVPRHEAVAWVRRSYDSGAVETSEQEEWVGWFADFVSSRAE